MTLNDLTIDLLATQSDDTQEDCCDAICDYIATLATTGATITQADADSVLAAVISIDRDENYHAAHIRDAIRDNTNWKV